MAQPAGFLESTYSASGSKIQAIFGIFLLVLITNHALFERGFSFDSNTASPHRVVSLIQTVPALVTPTFSASQSSVLGVTPVALTVRQSLAVAASEISKIELRVVESPWRNSAITVVTHTSEGIRVVVAKDSYFRKYGSIQADQSSAESALRSIIAEAPFSLPRARPDIVLYLITFLVGAVLVMRERNKIPQVRVLLC